MKRLVGTLTFCLLSFAVQAKPVILLSYYDAFAKAKFNNSEHVALAVAERLKNDTGLEIKLCALPTAFDRSYAAIETCVRSLPEAPAMYLGLGEYGCEMKLETMGRNLDKNLKSPDNDGNLRNQIIVPDGEKVIGFNFPAPEMYCALEMKDRKAIEISNNAGSFVCNNTAYQFAHYYPEIPSGFIHVPANSCRKLEERNVEVTNNLVQMLRAAAQTIVAKKGTISRLPLQRIELEALRSNRTDLCRSEFFKRMKSSENISLWSFLSLQ